MSSSTYKGLPSADSEEIERVLKAKICFRKMSGSAEFCFAAPVSLLFSDPIRALVQSADAQICVNLEVSDIDIFYRFMQFVYTGNYDGYTVSESVNLADDTTNKFSFQTETSAKMVDSRETRPVFVEASNTTEATFQPSDKKSRGDGLFGASTSSASRGNSLFGASTSSAPSGSGLFGASTSSAPRNSLFGASTSSAPSGSGLFGASTSSAPSGSGLFGASTSSASRENSLFGASTSSAPSGSGLFGASTSSAPSGSGLFGSSTSSAPRNSLFGASTSSAPSGSGLFGASTSSSSGSLFGASTSASSAPSGSG